TILTIEPVSDEKTFEFYNAFLEITRSPNKEKTKPMQYRMENITPILYVEDMQRSLSFYVDILGFTNANWGDENFTSVNKDKTGFYL
ncbi:VOC family protein, partial [Acinetobacter baumannii]